MIQCFEGILYQEKNILSDIGKRAKIIKQKKLLFAI